MPSWEQSVEQRPCGSNTPAQPLHGHGVPFRTFCCIIWCNADCTGSSSKRRMAKRFIPVRFTYVDGYSLRTLLAVAQIVSNSCRENIIGGPSVLQVECWICFTFVELQVQGNTSNKYKCLCGINLPKIFVAFPFICHCVQKRGPEPNSPSRFHFCPQSTLFL